MDNSQLFIGIIQFLVLLLSLTVHECAHAWTANRLGDPTAKMLGRVSLNPVVHADLFGTIIFPLVGMVSGLMFGWAKPVPVNVNRLKNPARDHMLVAAAGPGSNLLLAGLMFTALMIVKNLSPDTANLVREVAFGGIPSGGFVLAPLAMVAFYGIVINVILAIFNFFPVPPLDGATVLSGLLPRPLSAIFDRLQAFGMIILILLVVQGVPGYFFWPAIRFLQSFLVAA